MWRGELDGFYVASLHEETLEGYAIYFALYLRKLVNDLNEARLSIEVNQVLIDKAKYQRPLEFIPNEISKDGASCKM